MKKGSDRIKFQYLKVTDYTAETDWKEVKADAENTG